MHEDAIPHSKRLGANIRSADENNLLSDTTVAAADTNAGLQAAVTAASGHEDVYPARGRIKRAIKYGKDDGTLTDAHILGLTTVAGAIALTQNSDSRREELPV